MDQALLKDTDDVAQREELNVALAKLFEYENCGCPNCGSYTFEPVGFSDLTMIICEQCEREIHVGCLRESSVCDLKVWGVGRWSSGVP